MSRSRTGLALALWSALAAPAAAEVTKGVMSVTQSHMS